MAKKAAKKVGKRVTFSRLTKDDADHLFDTTVPNEPPAIGDVLSTPYEEVNHPKHYDLLPNGIECIDVIRHFDVDKGNAIKYIWRAGKKPGADEVKDLEKAIFYLQDRIKEVQGKHRQMQ
jgi:hypothetical protein